MISALVWFLITSIANILPASQWRPNILVCVSLQRKSFIDTFWRPHFSVWRLKKNFRSSVGACRKKLISDPVPVKHSTMYKPKNLNIVCISKNSPWFWNFILKFYFAGSQSESLIYSVTAIFQWIRKSVLIFCIMRHLRLSLLRLIKCSVHVCAGIFSLNF